MNAHETAKARVKATPRTSVITIGIPSKTSKCPLEMIVALSAQSYPPNMGVGWSVVCGQPVEDAREKIVESALSYDAKYIWFIDDDTVPPMDAARKLFYVLEQEELKGSNVRICGGIYTYKKEPADPLVFMQPNAGPYWGWKAGEVFPCWGLGTGCMMIKADLFRHLPKPWFKIVAEPTLSMSDDMYFCDKVNKAGFEILAHGGVICRHWDLNSMRPYALPKDSNPLQEAR